MKTCTRCEILKPLDQFNRQRGTPDGLTYYCKTCNNERNRINRAKRMREAYSNNPLIRVLMRVHKLSKEEAEWWAEQWQGYCPLCGEETDKPVVDHCHDTLEVRGIICSQCNIAIGMVRESIDTLYNIIEYLDE